MATSDQLEYRRLTHPHCHNLSINDFAVPQYSISNMRIESADVNLIHNSCCCFIITVFSFFIVINRFSGSSAQTANEKCICFNLVMVTSPRTLTFSGTLANHTTTTRYQRKMKTQVPMKCCFL